jgi:hypothetical protein
MMEQNGRLYHIGSTNNSWFLFRHRNIMDAATAFINVVEKLESAGVLPMMHASMMRKVRVDSIGVSDPWVPKSSTPMAVYLRASFQLGCTLPRVEVIVFQKVEGRNIVTIFEVSLDREIGMRLSLHLPPRNTKTFEISDAEAVGLAPMFPQLRHVLDVNGRGQSCEALKLGAVSVFDWLDDVLMQSWEVQRASESLFRIEPVVPLQPGVLYRRESIGHEDPAKTALDLLPMGLFVEAEGWGDDSAEEVETWGDVVHTLFRPTLAKISLGGCLTFRLDPVMQDGVHTLQPVCSDLLRFRVRLLTFE